MNVVMLCVTIVALLVWVVYLKNQIGSLNEDIERLTSRLKRILRQHGHEVEPGNDSSVAG